jgi:hypothetical protein
MESQDGSLTEIKISKKVKIFKSHPIFLKQNSEKISKDCTRSDVTKVLDTNGDLKSEVNTLKLLVEEEKLSVSKERKSDFFIFNILQKYFNVLGLECKKTLNHLKSFFLLFL